MALQADSLPPELRDAKITRKDFMAAQQLVRKFHRVHVPLAFWQDTGHSCDVRSTQRLVQHVCKIALPEVRLAGGRGIGLVPRRHTGIGGAATPFAPFSVTGDCLVYHRVSACG